jgi:hypothetical protein
MKRKLSVLALPLVAGVALLSPAADSPASKSKSTDADTVRELRTQIIELRAQVETLRQRTQTLESSVEDLKRSHVPVPLNLSPSSGGVLSPSSLVPSPSPSHRPAVWGQGEVNGWTYNIVPCEERRIVA